MNNLIIANVISLGAAACTCISSWVKTNRTIYLFQVGQCFLLAIASIFFDSYAGLVTLLLCVLRNLLLAFDIYNRWICVALAVSMAVFGVIFNNMGPIGYIVIIANVFYTLGAYFAKNELWIKINIIIDLVLWMIYEMFIIDIPSFISDGIAVIIAVVAIIRYMKNEKEVQAVRKNADTEKVY